MQTPENAYSYIKPIGYSTSRCGYCKNTGTGYSFYAKTSLLRAELYQVLIDRCWRRSGTLLYRPNQKSACCPHYTLRLDSSRFKPSKDQRQAINRFNTHVVGKQYLKEAARHHPQSREAIRHRESEFHLSDRVHEGELHKLHSDLIPDHKLIVTLEADSFSTEKFEVYANYQRVVHKEPPKDISQSGFERFLCNSPILKQSFTDASGSRRRLGSYHQCYRLDGKLVAVGVLDLLPHAVSAVYLFYHESIHKFNPGKLSAMREIALAAEEGYRYWYPGFYIHSNPKMRYKIDYSPQYVLDPETLQWDLLDKAALAVFDKYHYVSLSRMLPGRATPAVLSTDGDDMQMDREASEATGPLGESYLLDSDMPGIATMEDLEAADLDHAKIKCDFADGMFDASNLVSWDDWSIESRRGWKAEFAQLFAALGTDLIPQVCVDLRRASH